MQGFTLHLLILVILLAGAVDCSRARRTKKERSIVTLLDLIDDYCESEPVCLDDVTNDLIYYVSGEGYDEDIDEGTSTTTVLLEVIDDKCQLNQACFQSLYQELHDRVLDDPMADDDSDFGSDNDFEDNSIGSWRSEEGSGWEDWEEESEFERFEKRDEVDETVLNTLDKDECLDNREECQKWVDKEERLGLNHIGAIRFDEEGQPVASVPKSLIFKEELKLKEGADDPE